MITVKLNQLPVTPNVTFSSKAESVLILVGDSFPQIIKKINTDESLYLALHENKVHIKRNGIHIGSFEKIKLFCNGSDPSFNLIFPGGKKNTYKDHLIVKATPTGLTFYNEVFIENYIAGVMGGEIGNKISPEFLKVQAVCSRTYVFKSLGKHKGDGYDVCDLTHCQFYKSNNYLHAKYQKACLESKNEVIIYNGKQLIDAVFYANCGGYTANSEDVWANEIGYLRAVNDGLFCSKSINTNWKKMIPKSEFLGALSKYYKTTCTSFKTKIDESGRVAKLYVNGDEELAVTGENLRKLFKLKSSKFSINLDGSNYFLVGKGFGHGVGMCQDGAFERSEAGWDYKRIIKHYYQHVDIQIVQLSDYIKYK